MAGTDSSAAQQHCPICYDDRDDGSHWPVLPCGHGCCRPCLTQWFVTEETTGQEAPTCPLASCRQPVVDATCILGRAFVAAGSQNKKRKRPSGDSAEENLDESTKEWLEKNTLECGGCQGRLMKASGCDKLQCICGYRVCWKCREVGAKCNCNPGHGFVDPVTHMPSWSGAPVASPDELRDIKKFLEKRRREQPQHPFLGMLGPSSELRRQRRTRLLGSLVQTGVQRQFLPNNSLGPLSHLTGPFSWQSPHLQSPMMSTSGAEATRPSFIQPQPGSAGFRFHPRHLEGTLAPSSFPPSFWRSLATFQSEATSLRTPPSTAYPSMASTGNPQPSQQPPSNTGAAAAEPNPWSATSHALARLLGEDDLLRSALLRDLPDVFSTHENVDLQRALRLSLMQPLPMPYPAGRLHSFQKQQQEESMGTSASQPINVDDGAAIDDDNQAERSSIAHARKVSPSRSRDDEFRNDLEEAIRLSLLEGTDDPNGITGAGAKKNETGATSSNPVWLDDDDDNEDGAMNKKPAAIILRPVSTENEEIL